MWNENKEEMMNEWAHIQNHHQIQENNLEAAAVSPKDGHRTHNAQCGMLWLTTSWLLHTLFAFSQKTPQSHIFPISLQQHLHWNSHGMPYKTQSHTSASIWFQSCGFLEQHQQDKKHACSFTAFAHFPSTIPFSVSSNLHNKGFLFLGYFTTGFPNTLDSGTKRNRKWHNKNAGNHQVVNWEGSDNSKSTYRNRQESQTGGARCR